MKLSIVSGGFDPVHVGHVECFEKAKLLADHLFVIVNNDDFLKRKKSKPFMPFRERMIMIQALKPVTMSIACTDKDDSVCKTLEWTHEVFKNRYSTMMFCNGGDRTEDGDTLEHKLCLDLGIDPVYGLGEKIQSSSWLTSGDKQTPAQERQSNAGSLFF